MTQIMAAEVGCGSEDRKGLFNLASCSSDCWSALGDQKTIAQVNKNVDQGIRVLGTQGEKVIKDWSAFPASRGDSSDYRADGPQATN